ncbi:MAG: DUF1254 domain-containing protein, partial [Piscirickettsiaceae bacterium]|nr:DUF1254 domain-containing protein [Piscirickettsiaceae bacterium]
MNKLILSMTITALLALTACGDDAATMVENEKATLISEEVTQQVETTTVTEENYDIAETQGIIESYIKKIAKATNTDGIGVFWHDRKTADPKDKTIPRINFDTIYSWTIVDLTEELTLTMPETGSRYQSAWIVDEEHYNPMAFNEPGEYKLTEENVGTRYAVVAIRTQVNSTDPDDLAKANKAQDGLMLLQKDKGAYVPSYKWNHDEVKNMRAHFEKLAKDKGITSEVMFGKKGERTPEQHRAGTAVGWGGFTPEQAVYPLFYPTSTEYQTLTLKEVPTDNFWSVTVYDEGGFAATDTYNINSQFAVAGE